jgi:hypothetical protein
MIEPKRFVTQMVEPVEEIDLLPIDLMSNPHEPWVEEPSPRPREGSGQAMDGTRGRAARIRNLARCEVRGCLGLFLGCLCVARRSKAS